MDGLIAALQLYPEFLSGAEIAAAAAAARASLPTFPSIAEPYQGLLSTAHPESDEALFGGAWGQSVARSRARQSPQVSLSAPNHDYDTYSYRAHHSTPFLQVFQSVQEPCMHETL
jgi:hypothetical protein